MARSTLTISEVAADWHELMISQHTMRPSIARVNEQQGTCGLQLADIPPPQSATLGLLVLQCLMIACGSSLLLEPGWVGLECGKGWV